jgi:Ca2+-binding EF-hand superfamily protein
MMALFRDKIKARGARGIMGIQRIFKIMDDNNSRTLSLVEFSKACRDFKIGISDEYIPTIFDAYDINHDGTLSIDEFLYALRGEMNEQRTAVVTQAFKKLDRDGSGYLNIMDIRDLYRADRHPDVIQGKRT